MHENKYKGTAKEERAYTLVKWVYSIFYYLISSIAGYMLIKDTSFFPTWLGGHGACMNIIFGAPAILEATNGMKIYYLFQFGKHFARLFIHMFIHQEGNYYEYVLHHSLSTFLIFFSYLTNQWLIGIMVLLCHDISDLFLIFCRGYKVRSHYSGLQELLPEDVELYLPGVLHPLVWRQALCFPRVLRLHQSGSPHRGGPQSLRSGAVCADAALPVDGVHAPGAPVPPDFLGLLHRESLCGRQRLREARRQHIRRRLISSLFIVSLEQNPEMLGTLV